jgi:hypothetical protein
MKPIYIPLQDLQRGQFENQFTVAPGDSIFDNDYAFFITRVQAGGGWSISQVSIKKEKYTIQGSGTEQFYIPIACLKGTVFSGITSVSGFYLNRGVY